LPSPIAHTAVGYLIYKATRERLPKQPYRDIGPLPLLLGTSVVFSMLPDVDGVFGILAGDFGRYHNNGTHSLVVGFVSALIAAGAFWLRFRAGFLSWFSICFISYTSHVLMDYLTIGGRGVMLLWPFTSERFDTSIKLFYGVRWSNGVFAIEHLWTVLSEVGFVLLVILMFRAGSVVMKRASNLSNSLEK
jgi:inner membrane protein